VIDPLRPLNFGRPAITPVVKPERTGRRDPDEEQRRRDEERKRQSDQEPGGEGLPGTPDDEGHLDVLA
jgi:hypothetical protein